MTLNGSGEEKDVAVVRSARSLSIRCALVGLLVAGCAQDDQLDTDSPWPADPRDGGGLDTYEVVLEDMSAHGGDTGPAAHTTMTLVVEDGMVEVFLEGIEVAPCDDFAATAVAWERFRIVSGTFVHNDCGAPSRHNVRWSFPAPEQPGEWELWIGGDQWEFTVE